MLLTGTLRSRAAALLCAAGVTLTAPALADASTRVGTSGWTWGNPTPTGSTIRAMDFQGARGYAAGTFGTLVRTDDAGATWSGLPTGLLTTLTELQVISPDAFVVGGGCAARRSVDGGATFTRLYFTSGRCRQSLEGLAFTDADTGYLVLTDGTVIRSADGGATWSPGTAVPGTRALGGNHEPRDLAFLGPATGFAATTEGHIYRTTDAAGSWTLVSATSRGVNDVTFVDATTGFAVGADGLFLATADGGATWASRDAGAGGVDLTTVRAASATAAMATSDRGDFLLRTTDGGASFTRVTAMTQAANAVSYASPAGVVAAGADGAMAASGDGGATFAAIGVPRLSGRFFLIRAAPGGAAFAAGEDGTIARTTDGGGTWTRVGVPTSEDLADVSFPTAQTGYAIDTDGRLFTSANGGTSWASRDTGSTARPTGVYAPTAGTVLLVGPKGVRRSTDGARSFASVRGVVSGARLSDYDDAGTTAFVYGTNVLLRSADRGRTWTRVKLPSARTRIQHADFVTARTGYLGDTRGRLYRTTDGGARWTELEGTGTTDWYGMSFASASSGFLVTDRFGRNVDLGYLLRTTDGGRTWAPQLVTDAEIRGYGIAAGPTSYVLAGTNSLLSSTTGGVFGRASVVTVKPSRTKVARRARIRVTVTVRGARQGDVAVVAARRAGGDWSQQQVELDSAGRATTSWTITATTRFVGQWAGNEAFAGGGSAVATVRAGR
jgi:photosystem II stability/assembly factor-like uncharacterized protein